MNCEQIFWLTIAIGTAVAAGVYAYLNLWLKRK